MDRQSMIEHIERRIDAYNIKIKSPDKEHFIGELIDVFECYLWKQGTFKVNDRIK